jgi:hypothetical protein
MMVVRQPLVPEAFAHLVVNEQSRYGILCAGSFPLRTRPSSARRFC